MSFIARVTKPCTFCGVEIPRGSSGNFTWDRKNSGFIHLDCMHKRRGSLPAVAVSVIEPVTQSNGNGNGHNGNGHGAPAETLLKALQALVSNQGLHESEIRRIAADEAAKVSISRSIEIKTDAMPAVKLDLAHKDIPLLLKLVSMRGLSGHRFNVYMHGPAGSGKSTAARQVAEALKLPYGYIALNPQTPDSRLLGYMHAGGEYVPSEFFKRYTEGGVFCMDEIDNAAASLATTLNGLLENGHGAFPHGVFPRHENFVCIVTANTIGRGGNIQYPERRALDSAFLERFIFLKWDYDTALTKTIVTGTLGSGADEFISWLDREKGPLQAQYPTLIISPRAYITGAILEKNNLTRNQIIDMVVARGLMEGSK